LKTASQICAFVGLDQGFVESLVLDDIHKVHATNLSELNAVLLKKPILLVVQFFDEWQKNEAIISLVKRKHPETKIVFLNASKENVRLSLDSMVYDYLSDGMTTQEVSVKIEEMVFSVTYGYGSSFEQGIIEVSNNASPLASDMFWYLMFSVFGALVFFFVFAIS